MPDLLIELFSEEIPARMQGKAAADLQKLVTDGLVEAGLTYKSVAAFSTPRRLTLSVEDVLAESKPVREERKGPKVGAPDQAIDGFLRGAGVTRDDLEIRDDKKGQVYFAVIQKPGRLAADVIAEVLEGAVRNFPWPKSMRWGEKSAQAGSLKWVRPLQSILCLYASETEEPEVIDFEIGGVKSGAATRAPRRAPRSKTIDGHDKDEIDHQEFDGEGDDGGDNQGDVENLPGNDEVLCRTVGAQNDAHERGDETHGEGFGQRHESNAGDNPD